MKIDKLNKNSIYSLLEKSYNATLWFGFFMFTFLASLSIADLVINPENSPVLNGTMDPLFWIQFIGVAALIAGTVYGMIATPVVLATQSINATTKNIQIFKGLLVDQKKVITYEHIIRVGIHQNMIQRALNVVELSVEDDKEHLYKFSVANDTARELIYTMPDKVRFAH